MPISETKKAQDLVIEYKVRLEEALKPNAVLNQRLIRVIGLNTEVLLESMTQTEKAKIQCATCLKIVSGETTKKGHAQNDLLCIGPMSRGTFWEIVAVPDIRWQCHQLARRVASVALADAQTAVYRVPSKLGVVPA